MLVRGELLQESGKLAGASRLQRPATSQRRPGCRVATQVPGSCPTRAAPAAAWLPSSSLLAPTRAAQGQNPGGCGRLAAGHLRRWEGVCIAGQVRDACALVAGACMHYRARDAGQCVP